MKYIIDLDGTLMSGNKAITGSVEFIRWLQENSDEFIIMTNSMSSPKAISSRLENVNILVDESRILNPICAINRFVAKNKFKNAYLVGSEKELQQIDIPMETINPSVVILLDFERDNKSYSDLQNVFQFAMNGVPVIAASRSLHYLKNGKRFLDTGSFVRLFEEAADIQVDILGKPSETYFEIGIEMLDSVVDFVTVIGDDYNTDIYGAKTKGCQSVLVRSGKYQKGDELKGQPDKCVDNLLAIIE